MLKTGHLKTYHPKGSVPPSKAAIEALLSSGWIAQPKIDGWRAQIHRGKTGIVAFTRNGNPLNLPVDLKKSLMGILGEGDILEAEWVRDRKELYPFDLIAMGGTLLKHLSFEDRYSLLPPNAPKIAVLPVIREIETICDLLKHPDHLIEGVVFRKPGSLGFKDEDIVRCRREEHRHFNFGKQSAMGIR